MARRRGIFAELAHQAAVAENNRQRAQAAAVRDQARRQRESERATRDYVRIRAQGLRADNRAALAYTKKMEEAHIAAQQAEVERLNGELALRLADIDNLLCATLEVDDFVNLEHLRKTIDHPPFESPYSSPIPAPTPVAGPPAPVYIKPESPRGMGAVFGGKKKHAEAAAAAHAAFAQAYQQWQQGAAAVPMQQLAQLAEHRRAEEVRLANLAADRARYDEECAERDRETEESNASLDELIRDLSHGAPGAVEDYVGIVFGNSVYPTDWPWPPEYSYDADTKELSIQLKLPAPRDLPSVRQYKYVRANDTITAADQTQREQRERYASVVNNMTLRTLHEVWEADRVGNINSVSLVGAVSHIDPATGRDTATPLIAVAVERSTFEEIDLRRVTPAETLRHLGAVVSKNPHALTPIKLAPGVRAH